MANRTDGDHFLALLPPIDPGTMILIVGRDMISASVGRCTASLAGHAMPSSLRVYLPRLPLRQKRGVLCRSLKEELLRASRRH